MIKKKEITSLAFIVRDNQILLGMKKKGFGIGWWDGFGGKLKKGEKIIACAKRELLEEVGILANKISKRAKITFYIDTMQDELEVHVYKVLSYSGEPVETEEMKPKWFNIAEIPYDKMWSDDIFWLPLFLANRKFSAKFWFEDILKMKRYEFFDIK